MSTRQMGFGLSRELAEKNAAKYSAEDEVCEISLFSRSTPRKQITRCIQNQQ